MTSMNRTNRTKVFVSYSRQDSEWLKRLRVHLKPIERQGLIDLWDDGRIRPGEPWKEAIARALDEATVAVLLVSADFLASEFVDQNELPPLLERAERAGVTILPLIVGDCLLEAHELGRYQSVNSLSRPLKRLSDGEQDEVYVALAREVMERVKEAQKAATGPSTAAAAENPRPQAAPAVTLHPRVLVAGPGFGMPLVLRRALEELWAEEAARAEPDPERLRALVRDRMSRYPEVAQAQMAAIVRYEVIIDLSPWRALARWNSLGLQDATVMPGGLRSPDPVFWCLFPAGEVPPAEPERALERVRHHVGAGCASLGALVERFKALAEIDGVALSGLGETARAWALALLSRLPPGAGVVVDEEPAGWLAKMKTERSGRRLDEPLTEVRLGDYLRALRVVAGQVRLTGETDERPIEEVFVEVALVAEEQEARGRRRRESGDREAMAIGGEAVRATVVGANELAPNTRSGPERFALSEELEEEYELRREEERRAGRPTLTPENLLGLGARIVLRGVAGTGKSTLLRWLACREAAAYTPTGRVPVLVALADLRPHGDLLEQCAERALEYVGLPGGESEARRELHERLAEGRAVLFLDGFDEAASELRDVLGYRLRHWSHALHVLVSSRPTAGLMAAQAVELKEVQLLGLAAMGAETFLRRYFGEEPWIGRLLADLRRLPEGERWRRIPVLLALAAALYRAERQLPGATLELYENVVAFLIGKAARHFGFTDEDVKQARAALERFCLGLLLPEQGQAQLSFPAAALEALPCGRALVRMLLASGLFIGEVRMRFAHLTLGEYLAARSCEARLEAELQRLGDEDGRATGEVLPMSLALAAQGTLEQMLARARQDVDDHRFLALLLRAIGYGGVKVEGFAERHAEEVLQLLAERFQLASGRFAEEERRLARHAERAMLALRPRLGGDTWRVFAAGMRLRGRLGAEARILGWLAGAPLERLPCDVWDEELAQRSAEALVRAGATVDWILMATQGEGDSNVRAAAVRALASDPESRARLRQCLLDDDGDIQAAAVSALAFDPESRPMLRQCLDDQHWNVRVAAVNALALDPESRPLIQQRLEDEDEDVRAAAVNAVASDPEPRLRLRQPLIDQPRNVRAAAVSALASDPESRPRLRQLLTDQDWNVRAAAVSALASDPESHPLLRRLLGDKDADVRAAAIDALASDPESRPRLQHLLEEQHWNMREVAMSALASAPQSRPRLRQLLEAQDEGACAAAVSALASDPESRPRLRQLLGVENADVRAAAVSALASDPESRPPLRQLLGDEDAGVREVAVSTLASDSESRPLLRQRLHDEDVDVRAAAVSALASDPESRPLFGHLLDDEDVGGRVAVVSVLASDPESRPLLRHLLDDEDADVRAAAVSALASDPESRHLLQQLLNDEDVAVRAAAVSALASDPESRPRLRQLLDDERADVRAAAVKALAFDPESRPLLRQRLDDAWAHTRSLVMKALHEIGRAPDAQQPLAAVPFLRIPLALLDLPAPSALSPTEEELLLQERLAAYIHAPRYLHFDQDPALAQAVIGWLLVRLTWAAEGGKPGPHGRIFGTLAQGIHLDGTDASSTILVRIAMLDAALPAERLLYPIHNLIEAWRVARYLRTTRPLTLWLACADVNFADLFPPPLEPGQVHWGPTYYGFRLAEGPIESETVIDPLFELMIAFDAAERWARMTLETQARALDSLGQLLGRTDLDIWSLVPFLGRLAEVLPAGMKQRLVALVPHGTSEIARVLDAARTALGALAAQPTAPFPAAGKDTIGPRARLAERLNLIRRLLRESPADWTPALQAVGELPALLQSLPALADDDLVEIVGLLDQLLDRHRAVPAARQLLEILDALPERPKAHLYLSRRATLHHHLELFLHEREIC
jgi:HEAT repeat protein